MITTGVGNEMGCAFLEKHVGHEQIVHFSAGEDPIAIIISASKAVSTMKMLVAVSSVTDMAVKVTVQ